MQTSKNTKSKRASGNPTRKELEAYMNEKARVMRNNNRLAIAMPIAPGQGFKPKQSSVVHLMTPKIRKMAQRDREKKLAKEFIPFMVKAKTQSIKKRLDNLNKSSPKAKTQSIKKRLDNLNKSSPKKKELLDLEAELSDEKWSKRLDNLNKSSPKKKKLLDLEAELSDEKWYGGKKRRKQKTKKHKKKRKTRKNRKKSKK